MVEEDEAAPVEEREEAPGVVTGNDQSQDEGGEAETPAPEDDEEA